MDPLSLRSEDRACASCSKRNARALYQVDLARLAEVRKRREEAEQRRAEEEAEAAAAREKMEKAAKDSAAAGPQKLNPLEVTNGSRLRIWLSHPLFLWLLRGFESHQSPNRSLVVILDLCMDDLVDPYDFHLIAMVRYRLDSFS